MHRSVNDIASARRRGLVSVAALAVAGAAVLAVVLLRPAVATAACDRTASPSSLASKVAAAKAGQTICLASGDYGTWEGTGKRITLQRARSSRPTMEVDLGQGDGGFTINGMSGMGGTIDGGARNITIRNSSFAEPLYVGAAANVVLDRNHFDWPATSGSGGDNAKLFVDTTGTLRSPGLTVKRSTFRNGDLDGIHIGGGSGLVIAGNEFGNLCDRGANHTDNIQFDTTTTTQVRIARNYVHAPHGCETQGITSYDAGTSGVIIEDNVVDIRRPWGIELYADRNSIVRHNTIRWYPDSGCFFNGIECGQIDISRKDEDPAGSGTQVYDNLARVNFGNGSTGSAHHNASARRARFVGPLTRHAGFRLHRKSRVGRRKASDRTDLGARITAPRKRASKSAAASPQANAGPHAGALQAARQPSGARRQSALVANVLLTIARMISGVP